MIDQQQESSIGWHLDKRIPFATIIALLIQTFIVIIWATRLDYRVDSLEKIDPAQNARITKLEEIASKVAVMEERQLTTIHRLDIQTKTMQEILTIVGNLNKPAK